MSKHCKSKTFAIDMEEDEDLTHNYVLMQISSENFSVLPPSGKITLLIWVS